MTPTYIRNSLSAAIAITLTAAAAVPTRAFAQQAADTQTAPAKADPSKDGADLGTITVTGYRYSIEKSLDQKRDSNDVVDVITAEDISKFPDINVADALQRVPGVIITRDGGEGKNVSVRGLSSDLTLTELNGNYIATAESNGDPTRSFNYLLMPANMLGSAELFKTQEARFDEGGIGGTVILHTRRPLDLPSGSGFGSVQGTWSNTTKDADPQVSGMYSWHSDDDRFGLLAGLSYQKRETRSMQVSTESWQWFGSHGATDVNGHSLPNSNTWWGEGATTVNGNPGYGYNTQSGQNYSNFFRPQSVDFGIKDETRERKSGQLTGQFKPSDNLTFTANYFRFDLQDNYTLSQLKIPEWNYAQYPGDGTWPGGRHLTGLNFDPSGTIVTGAQFQLLPGKTYYCSSDAANAAGLPGGGWGADDCSMPTPAIAGEYHIESAKSQTFDLEAEWHSDFIDADFKGGRTWASGGPSQDFKIQIKPRIQLADGTYASGNTVSDWNLAGTPSMTFSPNLMQNLLNGIGEIDAGSSYSSWTRNTNYQNYFQADFTKHFDSWLDSIQFGAKYRDGGVHRSTGNYYWNCPNSDPTNYYNVCPNDLVYSPSFMVQQSLGNIPGGFTTSSFPAINMPAVLSYLDQTYGGSHSHPEDNFVYNVDEKIWSTYFQANFKTDNLRGNVGVRVVRTEQHADSTDQVNEYIGYFQHDAGGNVVDCLPGGVVPPGYGTGYGCQGGYLTLPSGQQQSQTWVLSSVNRTYTDVLPSANLVYNLTDDLLLRGAASKAISRPAYADIATPGSLTYYSPTYVADYKLIATPPPVGWSGSGSNKELQPYKSTNFDLALEWYFRPGAVLGADLFRKNVSNFAVPISLTQTMVIGGQAELVSPYSTTAGGRNGTSTGVELYAQYTLDFGLGFQANYTYNKTNEASVVLADGTEYGKVPLVGSAKNQANFTVFYETKQWLLRASFNHRGEVVEGVDGGGQTGLLIYDNPYNQIDLNASYNFSDQFSITGSVLNASNQELKSHLGNDTKDRFYSSNYSGCTLYFGATYKF